MKQQQYLEEIAGLLEAILEETEIISSYTNRVPQIELDLVLDNIRRLYDAYQRLNKANSHQTSNHQATARVTEAPPQAEAPTPIAPSVPKEELNTPEEELTEIASEPQVVQAPPRPEITDEPSQPVEKDRNTAYVENQLSFVPPETPSARYSIPKRPSEISIEAVKHSSNEAEKNNLSIAEKYMRDEKTLNDKVDKGNGFSIADRLQKNGVSDLKVALGINDKFLFINDLFHGDSEKYNEAIDTLNSFNAFQEASVFLQHLQKQYGWESESPVFQKLNDFLRRRYL